MDSAETGHRIARFSPDNLRELLRERILVFDGAMGTQLQERQLTAADFGGPELEGCNEILVETRPDVVRAVHEAYYAAGADVVETDSFGGTPLVLGEYGLQDRALELNRLAARIARDAALGFERPGRPRLVAGSMGPTTKTLSVTGGITFDAMVGHYEVQAEGLVLGGADLLLVETCLDTGNAKAALVAIQNVLRKLGLAVPVMLSGTIENFGTMLAGQAVDALHASVEHANLVSIGLNCSTGPSFMTDHIRTLSEMASSFISCMPNAGLPDADGCYNETPEMIASTLGRFVEHGWLNIVGSCCGSTPKHTRLLAELADGKRPRVPQSEVKAAVSGVDYLDLDFAKPVIVGERTNVIGSRKFKEMVVEGKWEEAAEIGRRQVRNGAHVLDVCLANPDRDEAPDILAFLEKLVKIVRVPLMIDSTDAAVFEAALKLCQGKCILNSINLEDGEERFERVVPLIRRYGAAVVVGCIDEDKAQGMAVTRQRKLEVARRSHELLTRKYGLPERDIIFDPLVFPCGTGDANYQGSGRETIEGVRLIKEAFPGCRTILGISNVSFGLPASGREILNSVFLQETFNAGLDLAIVNSEKLERFTHIPAEEIALCMDLIDFHGGDPVAAFSAHFRGKAQAPKVVVDRRTMPLDERLAKAIVEGSKEGLLDDLKEALEARKPLDIINGPLMNGMSEVGRLFNDNQLIVAEVLQSAEVMKAAVSFLEPFMEKSESSNRGKILLATVKGDVHDIGKNLVEIILGNNGYQIVNLGIKVPPQDLIQAARDQHPDLIGLSGLLVKSAQQMVVTAEDLKNAGIEIPVLVGGAALTERFTHTRIQPAYGATVAYARDAMGGLDIANQLMDPEARPRLEARLRERRVELSAEPRRVAAAPVVNVSGRSVRHDVARPAPPDLKLHVLPVFELDPIFAYINPAMLYNRHLGLRGKLDRLLAAGDRKAEELQRQVLALQDEVVSKKLLRPRAVYKFFNAAGDGNDLVLANPDRREAARFHFLRQPGPQGLCLADFVASADAEPPDTVCLFVTTCGDGVRALADELKDKGEYLKSHALQALALESAEAFAELLHHRIREMWGIRDAETLTMEERWQARYQGIRVSFGYPACPRLEDQEILFRLLEPDKHIGVSLTEEYMMEPEASVSALVFHHPDARYFAVGEAEELPASS
jgi:5-methyltetrahydrofolate--homocysteine methyltransferase